MTQERKELEERIKTNGYCCLDCGREYLTLGQKNEEGRVSTFHKGVCVVCNQEKSITHIRNFNWLREVKTK